MEQGNSLGGHHNIAFNHASLDSRTGVSMTRLGALVLTAISLLTLTGCIRRGPTADEQEATFVITHAKAKGEAHDVAERWLTKAFDGDKGLIVDLKQRDNGLLMAKAMVYGRYNPDEMSTSLGDVSVRAKIKVTSVDQQTTVVYVISTYTALSDTRFENLRDNEAKATEALAKDLGGAITTAPRF